MSNTWTHIARALTPDYEKLVDAVATGPTYRCQLIKKGRKTILSLHEYWKIDNNLHEVYDHYTTFDDHINWIDAQLKSWKDVRRMAWDQWYFKNKHDAEKFITLFNLKWVK